MNNYKNARTTAHSRALIIERVVDLKQPVGDVALALGISERTVYKWLARFKAEGMEGLQNRSSTPHHFAHQWPAPWTAMVERLRRDHRSTAYEISQSLKIARSTVSLILKRLGLNKLKLLDPVRPVRRYEWSEPGDLIHLDVKKLARFNKIGHRMTGNRKGKNRGLGYECVHVCVDDHSRIAYVEVLPDEKKYTAIGFLLRAIRWFRKKGISIKRVMTDNGSCYRSGAFARACKHLGARHIRTKPYTPQTNGKAERFIQTMIREWAYALPYSTSDARTLDLPRWLNIYNCQRPHGGINMMPPISRITANT